MQEKGKANLHNFTLEQFIELSNQKLWSAQVNILQKICLLIFSHLSLLQTFLKYMLENFPNPKRVLVTNMSKHCDYSQIC